MVPTNLERVTVALASGMLGIDDDLWLVRCCIVDAYRMVKLGRSVGSLFVFTKSTLWKPVLLAVRLGGTSGGGSDDPANGDNDILYGELIDILML